MTEIKLQIDPLHLRLDANRHAGDRIICMACSVTVSNLINILENEEEHLRLQALNWRVGDGYCEIEATAYPMNKERFEAIQDYVRISLEALAEDHKEHIKLDVYVGER